MLRLVRLPFPPEQTFYIKRESKMEEQKREDLYEVTENTIFGTERVTIPFSKDGKAWAEFATDVDNETYKKGLSLLKKNVGQLDGTAKAVDTDTAEELYKLLVPAIVKDWNLAENGVKHPITYETIVNCFSMRLQKWMINNITSFFMGGKRREDSEK